MTRKALLWILWSPKRFALTLVAILVAIALAGAVNRPHAVNHPHAAAQAGSGMVNPAGAGPPPSAVGTVTPPSVVGTYPGEYSPAPVPAPGVTAAVALLDAYARKVPKAAWLAGMAPYVTPTLASSMSVLEPFEVPDTTVVPGPIQGNGDSSGGEVLVPTKDGTIAVIVVHGPNGAWQANYVGPP